MFDCRYHVTSPLIRFSGLHSRLEYIKSLGFDSIWLSPIFAVGSIALGDDVTDFKKYNPDLGTDEEFQAFFEAVSEMGEFLNWFCRVIQKTSSFEMLCSKVKK